MCASKIFHADYSDRLLGPALSMKVHIDGIQKDKLTTRVPRVLSPADPPAKIHLNYDGEEIQRTNFDNPKIIVDYGDVRGRTYRSQMDITQRKGDDGIFRIGGNWPTFEVLLPQ